MKLICRMVPLFLASFLALGCTSSSPRGEAITYGQGNFKTTKLPFFSIGTPTTQEFTVSGLKERAYPYKVRIETRKGPSDYIASTPFETARLKVEILDYSSRAVLATKTFRLNTWRRTGEGEFDQYFWAKGQPAIGFRERYRVRVTVVETSIREWDKARFYLR